MTYDFKTAIKRDKQGSAKWLGMKDLNPNIKEDVYPYSVADSDIPTTPEIVEGLKKFLDEAPLGYTKNTKEYDDALKHWLSSRHGWEIDSEWVVLSPGVVTALYNSVQTFTKQGESVIIMSPVYYPFRKSIEDSGRTIVESSLIRDGSSYKIDFEDFERRASDKSVTMFILCNPHNPIGRVWTKEELEKISEICFKHDVLVISDEIHFDLIMPGHKHYVFANLNENAKQNCIVCTAPSKTFNLAGLQTSNIIIPNPELRKKYNDYVSSNGFHMINILGMKACELAYTKGEAWLEEFLKLIEHNHNVTKEYFEKYIPKVEVLDLEGTYLQWLDFRKIGMDYKELEQFMINDCQLILDEGYIFGTEGQGYERINLACPTHILVEGLDRLKTQLEKRNLL